MTNTGISHNSAFPERPKYNNWKEMEEKLAKTFISQQYNKTSAPDELGKIDKKRGTIV